MKLAIISMGGKSSKLIAEEAKKHFAQVDQFNIKGIELHATTKNLDVLYKGQPLKNYDCVYIRGSHKYALLQRSLTRALQFNSYMPIAPEAFTLAHNKFLTLLELQKNKVEIPTTYLAATTSSAKKILEKVNYPIIIKLPSGTHGKGVMFADSISSAGSVLDTLDVSNQPYIIQEYIETNATDIRVIVAGNKVLAAMKRKAQSGELRANIHMGAIGEKYDINYDTEQLAIKSAKALGADICAVDILEGSKSSVLEVNLSPGLSGIMQATKLNLAEKIAEFLAEKTAEFKKTSSKKGYKDILEELELTQEKTPIKEILTNLEIKAGIIKIPKIITDITKFTPDDEVKLIIAKDKLIIQKHEIEK